MATQYCPFDVVGLGVSTIDILTIVDEFPSSEGVQRGIASKVEGGGPVATALVTLAKLGAHVGMIDHIGNDWRGSLILEEFRSHNVCIDMIQVDDNISSSMASILVRRRDGKRAIVYTPGTEKELTEDDISPKVIESA
ncbi:MAG: carbohydrate kinase family protein, partial [Aliifodinibius sp.]|nr:carbohydrate kinase family protein [Fodinibius sp.]NIV12380.1 carbohydrate kinase family protein [Fodinibius sp.]NIY26045.1 carbohydrate kinase family protein [Fodinibius sp.]